MAILKQRLNRKNSSGSYDTIYLETCATVVKMSETDSTKLSDKISSMDTAIAGKQPAGSYAAASHSHNGANLSFDSTRSINDVINSNYSMIVNANNEISSLKSSVSNGKSAVASAITDKGVSTSATASFNTMATNIRAIPTRSGKSIWVTVPSVAYSITFSATKGGTTAYSSYISALGKAKIELPGSDYVGTWTVTGTFNGKTDSRQVYVSEDTNDYFVELVFIPISGNVAVGNLITFDNKTWRVVHNSGNQWYLALSNIVENTQFGSNSVYNGSTLAGKCVSWQSANLSATALDYCNNVTVNNVTAKVFVPSYEQVNSGFSYYNSTANRICQLNGANSIWWTSSPDSFYVYRVYTEGSIGSDDPRRSYGFRPHVCITFS